MTLRLMTIAEAATLLGVSRQRTYALIREGRLPASTIPSGPEQPPPQFTMPQRVDPDTRLAKGAKLLSKVYVIPRQEFLENSNFKNEIFVWSRIEYRDMLNSGELRYFEQCSRLQITAYLDGLQPSDYEKTDWATLTTAGDSMNRAN